MVRTCASCRRRCFNPPTPCGVGRDAQHSGRIADRFQSTHPVRGGTDDERQRAIAEAFQSTHPVRGGTRSAAGISSSSAVSIHPPRAGWDNSAISCWLRFFVSIHPPRAGWDFCRVATCYSSKCFNPPTPCGVGPCHVFYRKYGSFPFQSTHPVRGGTVHHQGRCHSGQFQSTHPVRGGTSSQWPDCRPAPVSIHPPRAGWDLLPGGHVLFVEMFQSTHPVRGGTLLAVVQPPEGNVSIHPPRAGWDVKERTYQTRFVVSIHPPRAGWDDPGRYRWPPPRWFQSTHPVRGGTWQH